MAKIIIYIGIALIAFGLIWHFFGDYFTWLGNLPGDIKIENENSKIYFPITTMIVLSVLFSIILNLIGRIIN